MSAVSAPALSYVVTVALADLVTYIGVGVAVSLGAALDGIRELLADVVAEIVERFVQFFGDTVDGGVEDGRERVLSPRPAVGPFGFTDLGFRLA
ncbi:hypothetical protein, partial [Streptomyces sp. NPDC056730]|uniref:hypothetical protein n=1 Tax=Streptomyces sp. NPDC056730 TaxID=3345929 RepID=UPI00368873EE